MVSYGICYLGVASPVELVFLFMDKSRNYILYPIPHRGQYFTHRVSLVYPITDLRKDEPLVGRGDHVTPF